MNQQKIEYPMAANTFPELHLKLMIICNNAPSHAFDKQHFYEMKHVLLEQFATQDGFDVQIINKKCHSCKNGVWNHWERKEIQVQCNRCDGTSIYSTTIWKLKRYLLNDYLFHVPNGTFYNLNNVKYKNKIEGVIKHKPSEHNANFAYFVLMFIYDRISFYSSIKSYASCLRTNAKFKWKNCMKAAHNTIYGLLAYFGVKKTEFDDFDDLPF